LARRVRTRTGRAVDHARDRRRAVAVLVSRGCDPGDPGLRTRGPAGTAYDHGMSASGTDTSAQRLYFDDFVLDLKRGCLLRAEQEIPLRPKTFALLQFL